MFGPSEVLCCVELDLYEQIPLMKFEIVSNIFQ